MDDIYIIGKDRDELRDIITDMISEANALGMFINERKTRIVRLSDSYKYLQIRYSLSKTGKVIKRINPKSVTRERRRIKKYAAMVQDGRMKAEDAENACKSWMGDYYKIMSKQQIKNMKALYRALFGKELTWKPRSNLRMAQRSPRK